MPTNPPANPLPGAVYVDQSTNIAWVWTGTYWLQAYGGSQNYNAQVQPTTAIIPGYYAEPSPDSWFPFVGATAPLNPACGQIWIDNSVTPNYAQVWDCDTASWIQLGGVPGGDTNSIVSVVAPTVRVSGDALVSGDLWLNPTNNGISYWNGASWTQVSTPDTHTIYSAVTPATRYNGDTLIAGDLWTDPGSGQIQYWDGLAWNPITATDADHQLSATPPTLRPDGTALLVADLYTNTTSNTLFYWNGASWVRYNDTHSFHATAQPTTRPDGSVLEGGDQWFNPTTDQLYVWDATTNSWVLVTTNDTHSWWSAVAPATRPDATSLQTGDIWSNSTADIYGCHEVKIWNGTSWVCVGEKDTHSYLGGGAPALIARPDGDALLDGDIYIDIVSQQGYYYNTATSTWTTFGTDTHSWLGTNDPVAAGFSLRPNGTALQDGDIYIDTVSQQGYYYNTATTSWTLFGSDTHSYLGAGVPALTTRPNGTALQDGDQYIDTTTNQGYYYDTATSTWKLFGSDTHSFTGAGTPFIAGGSLPQTTRPDLTPLQLGDQYLDTNTNILYAYTGADWVKISGDTHSMTGNGTPYIALPMPGSAQQLTRPDTSPLILGDMFVDTSTNNSYYYNGAEWIPFGTDTHSFAGTGLPAAVAPFSTGLRPDNTSLRTGDQYYDLSQTNPVLWFWTGTLWRVSSYDYHSVLSAGDPNAVTPPKLDGTSYSLGDQAIDTTTNILWYWDGSGNWIKVSSDTHSITSATIPGTRPDSSPLQEGDQWVDTDYTPAVEYTYIGGAWRPNGDVSVVAALPVAGDFANQLLVNSTNNRMYRWDTTAGPSWVQVV